MTSSAEHQSKAAFHRNCADEFAQSFPSDRDWEVVMRFYSALQLVESYLVACGKPSKTHSCRKLALESTPQLAAVRRPYSQLRDLSEDVRYAPQFHCRDADIATSRKLLDSIRQAMKVLGVSIG